MDDLKVGSSCMQPGDVSVFSEYGNNDGVVGQSLTENVLMDSEVVSLLFLRCMTYSHCLVKNVK